MGIGASAGGLDAFTRLLRALPVDTGMAFVLVQHLDPTHESRLPDVLSRTTTMPVITATDRLRVEPNRVYVIPHNTSMTVAGGVLALTPRLTGAQHLPIDDFLCSLAREQGRRAIGVVLSGSGSDGTRGLKAIAAEDGITFVQDEKSAKFPSMPHSALVAADFVLPPEGIAGELVRISHHPYVNHAAPPRPGPDPTGDPDGPDERVDLSAVLGIVRAATGVDFAQYKPASIRRRIARRMLLQRIDALGTYVQHLRQTPQEVRALHDDLLIQVTQFFREPEGFTALQRSVFARLLKERTADEPIRIWVPGCASGEEAYSLVICLREVLDERDSSVPIQMFATDVSSAAITRARAGIYPPSIEKDVSPDRLRRFFVRTNGRYQVSKAIRDVCVFAQQDLTRDPPFSKLDLVSCCNVLIYFSPALQERVIPVLHYALKPTGFLKLGPSESVGRFTNLFAVVDKKHGIYARRPGSSAHVGFGLTAADRMAVPVPAATRVSPAGAAGWSRAAIEKEADRLVMGRYAPAGVIVTRDMEIVQFRGKTGAFLEAVPGAASLNLFKMVREGLASALRQAVHRAVKDGAPAKAEGLRVKTDDGFREVGLEVIPIGPAEGRNGRHYLVVFVESRTPGPPPLSAPGRGRRPRQAAERRVAELSQDLTALQEQFRAKSEEHDAAMEELRAVTEEAQSSNEELQSTNEELETSKEELQAVNEELTTVNDELNTRNLELSRIGDDLTNLLTSLHVPVVMVGIDLRIRRMTPVAERILNLAPSDVGLRLGDLQLGVEIRGLEALVRNVIDTLNIQEREVVARDGRWYVARVRPYRTGDNRIDGAVISLVDVDALKRGFEQTRQARDEALAIVETVRQPFLVLDAALRVVTVNASYGDAFQVRREAVEGQSLFDLGNRQWDRPDVRALLEDVLTDPGVAEDLEVEHDFETIGRRTLRLSARRIPSATDEPALILLAITDITEHRLALQVGETRLAHEQAAHAEAEAATVAKDKFLAVVAHELRTPLMAIVGWTRVLQARPADPAAVARALEVIERNAFVQGRLIEDLLDMSRIVAGVLRIDACPVMLAPCVAAAVGAIQPAAEAKGVSVKTALDEAAGPVRGDPARLQQIAANLLSNAINFTPGGGRVEVRLERRGSDVDLSVSDTGKGIAAEDLPDIFNRSGLAPVSVRSPGGMGLGLSIVRHLVELHGGTLRAESRGPGQGATFTVTLPLTGERPVDESEAGRIAARRPTAERAPALDGVRVLVVGDEVDGRELVRAILAHCGAEVTATASAQAALEALEHARFDVLVSDIVMAGQDGYDLIRKVRTLAPERGGQIPALVLTAQTRPVDRMDAIAAGYQEHAAKPIDPVDLAAAIATLAGRVERTPGQ